MGAYSNKYATLIGHFAGSPGPLFQNERRCSAFDMEIIFHSHANKTHFHKKGCAPSLILKERVFRTQKWPIPRNILHWRLLSDTVCPKKKPKVDL